MPHACVVLNPPSANSPPLKRGMQSVEDCILPGSLPRQNNKKESTGMSLLTFTIFCTACILSFFLCVWTAAAQESTATAGETLVDQAQQHFKRGKAYSEQGDYTKANEEFKKAQELLGGARALEEEIVPFEGIHRQELEPVLKDARAAASAGNTKLAIRLYQEALTLSPQHPRLHYNLAVQYLKAAQWDDAAREFIWVIRLNPLDKEAYYNLGILYEIFFGKETIAVSYYRKYLELAPDAPDAKMVHAWIARLEKKPYERR